MTDEQFEKNMESFKKAEEVAKQTSETLKAISEQLEEAKRMQKNMTEQQPKKITAAIEKFVLKIKEKMNYGK